MARKPVVGVFGAGRMGAPIIGHLVSHGFDVVVFDPDPAKRSVIEGHGAEAASDTRQAAEGADVVLVCVGYEEQVRELLAGSDGLLSCLARESIIAILSTISPAAMQAMAQDAASAGLHLLDAPVCRGGAAADRGELLTFIGGPADAAERLAAVARAYSSDVVHTGAVGTGQVAKAVNNLMLWACLVASHEGLALASRFGMDIEALRAALLTSSATNGALDNWGNQTMAWAEDDMHIVAAMAEHVGIGLPQAGVNREICRALKPRRYQLDRYGV